MSELRFERIKINDVELETYYYDDLHLMNVTAHPIIFIDTWKDKDKEVILPPCGLIIRAHIEEKVLNHKSNFELVDIKYVPEKQKLKILTELKEKYPNIIIVGSLITAIAYKQLVWNMININTKYLSHGDHPKNLRRYKVFN